MNCFRLTARRSATRTFSTRKTPKNANNSDNESNLLSSVKDTETSKNLLQSPLMMTWNEFFRLRKRLILFKRLAGGVPALCAFFTAEGAILSLPIFDPTAPIAGIDPLVMVGLGTALGSIAAFSTGSALLGYCWRLFNPLKAAHFDAKQRQFYARITAHRANVPPNPTQLNFSFDFYGEKVASVQDYRRWLKRQKEMISERQFK